MNILCRACKTPIRYDPVTSVRAINDKWPDVRFVVCSPLCAKKVTDE